MSTLTTADRAAIHRADRYELSGPLTSEDYRYQGVAGYHVRKLMEHGPLIEDEYSAEWVKRHRKRAIT